MISSVVKLIAWLFAGFLIAPLIGSAAASFVISYWLNFLFGYDVLAGNHQVFWGLFLVSHGYLAVKYWSILSSEE